MSENAQHLSANIGQLEQKAEIEVLQKEIEFREMVFREVPVILFRMVLFSDNTFNFIWDNNRFSEKISLPKPTQRVKSSSPFLKQIHPEDHLLINDLFNEIRVRPTYNKSALLRFQTGKKKFETWYFILRPKQNQALATKELLLTGIMFSINQQVFTHKNLEAIITENKKLVADAKIAHLSEKEKIILNLFAQNYSIREIAHETQKSYHTIDNYRRRLMKKLNCSKITELSAKANELGIN